MTDYGDSAQIARARPQPLGRLPGSPPGAFPSFLQTLKDGENNLTTYEYDGFDRLSKTRYPLPTQGSNASSTTDYEQLGYDANSNVTSRRLRDASTIAFTYDNLDRPTLKDLPGSEPDVSYTYDNLGRLTGASQTGNALGFTFDALSRNLTQVGPQGTVTSAWDLGGRRTRLTYPGSGLYVDYDYLVTGETTAIRENGASSGIGVLATYAYDDLGRRSSLTRGNGTATSYAYDPVSRLATLSEDMASTANDQSTTFSYNPASQIASLTKTNDAYAWTGHGNGSTASVANGLNQLTSIGGTATTHDLKGNVTFDPMSGKTYAYSSENLLTSSSGGTAATLAYDPAMRLYQVAAGATTRFAYDGLNLIAEYDGSNALQHRYVFGPAVDEPLVQYDGSGTTNRSWMHSDERGSVIAISDGSGVVTTINKYDEYGKPQSTNAGRFQYTGQLWLPEIGAYYYKARFYSPVFGGRFLQTDPIASAGGINLYAYVGNNPVNWSDPLGLECPVQPCGVPIVVTAPITVPQPPTLLLPGTYMPGGLGNMIGEMVTEISNDIREATSQNQCPTAPSIDDYLRSKSSPVAGMGQQFIDNGQQFNIDPRFVVSIMGAETGFGRRITAGQNNLFNNLYSGRQSPFDSFSRSIYSEFKMLRGPNYQDRLGSTGSVYSKYCNGADCANGLANINIFMSEQGADPNKLNNPCPEKVGK